MRNPEWQQFILDLMKHRVSPSFKIPTRCTKRVEMNPFANATSSNCEAVKSAQAIFVSTNVPSAYESSTPRFNLHPVQGFRKRFSLWRERFVSQRSRFSSVEGRFVFRLKASRSRRFARTSFFPAILDRLSKRRNGRSRSSVFARVQIPTWRLVIESAAYPGFGTIFDIRWES